MAHPGRDQALDNDDAGGARHRDVSAGVSYGRLRTLKSQIMRWDIFCRVVDNFGDAGVCWRLATNLHDRGEQVTLWIDQIHVLEQLAPEAVQSGIQIKPWPPAQSSFSAIDIPDVVIEAFACDPPSAYIEAMAERAVVGNPPVWINLEYLSAESWIDTHHGMPSPHPRYPLIKHFYFPGFSAESGGLLRGSQKHQPRDQTLAARHTNAPCRIFFFGYEQPALADWLLALSDTIVSMPPCPAYEQAVSASFKIPASVDLVSLPFVPQPAFDSVLSEHDLLFVRGEDSFVRAQWAGKPVFWQIYPQANGVHLDKLKAFYALYLNPALVDESARATLLNFLLAWNGAGDPSICGRLWPEIMKMLPMLQANAENWRHKCLQQDDLITRLQAFVTNLVKCRV